MASRQTTDWISAAPRTLAVLIGGACLALASGLFVLLAPGQALERVYGLRFLFLARGTLAPPQTVTVLAIDDAASQSIGLPADFFAYQTCADMRVGPLPPTHRPLPSAARLIEWPRCVHARALDILSSLGADTVLFDVTFRERDPHYINGIDVREQQDLALAQAMQRAGNVILTTKVHALPESHDQSTTASALKSAPLTPAIRASALGVGPLHIADVAPPYGRFYLFSLAETPHAGALVQALMFQLRQGYPAVLDAIPGARVPATGLPASAEALMVPGEIEATALQLRQLLSRPSPPVSHSPATAHDSASNAVRRWLSALGGESMRQINLYGPPGTLDTIGYADLLSNRGDLAAKVKGRTVFIGYQENGRPEQVDHFESYFERADGVHYSGVELAASLYANLLEDTTLRDTGPWVAAAAAAFAFIPLGLVVYWPRALGYGAAATLGALYLIAALYLFRRYALWLPVVVPLGIVLPLSVLTGAAWQALRQSRRSRELEGFLGRLLPREVVQRIRSNARRVRSDKDALAGACVATDVEGYSRLSENLSPTVLVRLMDRYFSTLTREVARHDGVVSNIAGDEMIGVWADDGAEPQNCRSACEAALAILDAVRKFNARHARTPLPTRIGVHFGPLTFGSLEGQAPLGAFGNTINTASRIQNLNKVLRTRVLVSSAVFREADGYLARDVGSFIFRNQTKPNRIHELLGHSVGATPDARRLCAEFAVALSACRSERVAEGLQLFRALLERFPEDGPTAYYVQYIAEHPEWNGEPIPAQ